MDTLEEIKETIKELKKRKTQHPEDADKIDEMIRYWEDLYDQLEVLRESD